MDRSTASEATLFGEQNSSRIERGPDATAIDTHVAELAGEISNLPAELLEEMPIIPWKATGPEDEGNPAFHAK